MSSYSAPDGGFVDTSSVGEQTFTVTATDLAGNTATVSHGFSVRYQVQPAGPEGSFLENPIPGGGDQLGSATLEGSFEVEEIIAIRFQLMDINGDLISDAHPALSIVRVTIDEDGDESYFTFSGSWTFEYDPDTTEYFFKFDPAGFSPGIYDLWIAFGDGAHKRIRVMLEERP